jgi:hypothetical protein
VISRPSILFIKNQNTIMKTKITFIIALFIAATSLAQNVTITPNGITPLQGGGALQKLTYAAIKALPNPQPGDQAYDLTYNCMRFYNGLRWVDSQSSPDAIEPNITGFRANYESNLYSKIAVDAAGNIYMAGTFFSTTTFGSTNLTSTGGTDIFVAKYLPNGTLSYVVKAGGTGDQTIKDMGIDSNNDVYVTGYFTGVSTTFGGITANNSDATGSTRDIFTAKFTGSTGAVSWLKTGGSPTESDAPSALTIDASNNVYLGASFLGSATFSGNSITSTGSSDALIIRYTSTGTLNLLQKGGGIGAEVVNDIAVAPDGSIIITGSFDGLTTTFSSLTATRVGASDMFLARYNTISSSWVDLRTAGGPNLASGSTNCTGQTLLIANNSVYVSGIFTNTVEFGSFSDRITAKSGKQEMFLTGYGLNGTPTLVLSSTSYAILPFGGGSYNDKINDISIINGALYICGINYFTARALSYLTQNSDSDFFVSSKKGFIIKCNTALSNSFWIKEIRSETGFGSYTNITNIAQGLNNSIIVCGRNNGNITLGGKNIQFGTFVATLEE